MDDSHSRAAPSDGVLLTIELIPSRGAAPRSTAGWPGPACGNRKNVEFPWTRVQRPTRSGSQAVNAVNPSRGEEKVYAWSGANPGGSPTTLGCPMARQFGLSLRFADAKHLGPALRAYSLSGGTAVLQSDLARTGYLPFIAALEAIGFHLIYPQQSRCGLGVNVRRFETYLAS